MAIELIKAIKEAEDKAESIRRDAAQQSKQMISNANAKAAAILDDARKKADLETAKTLKKAEDEAQNEYDRIIGNAEKDCGEVLKKADSNMNAATSIILERIVKSSGNS